MRERGQDADILRAARALHLALRNRLEGDADATAENDEGRTRIGTGPDGWSFFGSDAVWDAHQALISSLAVPDMARGEEEDPADMVGGAPEGLVDLVTSMSPGPEETEAMLLQLAFVTDGFKGLDETVCEDLSFAELGDLIQCATARIDPGEIAFWLQLMLGCEIESINADPEGEDSELLRHGDVVALVSFKDRPEPVPVIFHAGRSIRRIRRPILPSW